VAPPSLSLGCESSRSACSRRTALVGCRPLHSKRRGK
jgi:hypothetical protein